MRTLFRRRSLVFTAVVVSAIAVTATALAAESSSSDKCTAPTRYRIGARHSPLTCSVASSLRKISARHPQRDERVLMKVGDSITASGDFLRCFASKPPKLDASRLSSLKQALEHFRSGEVDGEAAFARNSLAAHPGKTANWAVTGSPAPLVQEIAATNARYAVVMFGTNDLWLGGSEQHLDRKYRWYTANLVRVLDELRAAGVVPVLSTIPPHNGKPDWFHDLVPTLNAIVWGIAQREQLPVMDYHEALALLPGNGLSDDGIHPNRLGHEEACTFDDDGLRYGYNVRNLLSLEALDRVWRVTRKSAPVSALDDDGAPRLVGKGSASAPFVIPELPFGDARSLPTPTATTSLQQQPSARQAACAPERAPGQLVYRLDVENETGVRALAIPLRGEARFRLQLYSAPPTSSCAKGGNTVLEARLPAGTSYLAVDADDGARPEEVLVVVTGCGDTRCR